MSRFTVDEIKKMDADEKSYVMFGGCMLIVEQLIMNELGLERGQIISTPEARIDVLEALLNLNR